MRNPILPRPSRVPLKLPQSLLPPLSLQVRKPDVGESKPAAVTAEVVVDTKPLRGDVHGEWDQVGEGGGGAEGGRARGVGPGG